MIGKNRFGISAKIITGYAVIIVCLVISIFVVNNQLSTMQKERNFIIHHDLQVHSLTNEIEKKLLEMENGQRGYVLTGSERFLKSYNAAENSWRDDFNQLYSLLADNPSQQNNLINIKKAMMSWVNETGEPIIALKKNNKNAAAVKGLQQENSIQNVENIRSQFEQFRSTEISLTEKRAAHLDSRNKNLTYGLISLLVVVIALSIGLALFISRSIVNTVKEVIASIKAMTSNGGDVSKRIFVKTKDEIRELAHATNDLLDSVEKRDWLQKSTNGIVGQYQGKATMNELGTTFISGVARSTDASYGAIYVRESMDSKKFIKKGQFAGTAADVGRDVFTIGEGLVGQCAIEKSPLLIENVPNDYILVSSALGEAQAKNVIIVPVLFEGDTIAVLELATLQTFTEEHKALIENVTKTFGLTVDSISGRMEIVRLLKESQALTEELQAQSEELQTQSEELQMQSEELRMINEQLEQRSLEAEGKSRELLQAKNELEEQAQELSLSSKYKSEFLANMSHELRTPLNSILILSEMLAENAASHQLAEDEEFARVIHSSGQDLLHLINDILDLSKVEAGKLEMLFNEVNMSELPQQLERNFAHVAQQKGLDFRVAMENDVPPLIYTDETRVQQILKNLLSNAIKFTERGTVAVHISSQAPKEKRVEANHWLCFAVSDTGIGIPKEKHDHIFEAFQQGDGATARKFGGTGLGLSISLEFIKLLGGTLELESEEGKGSTFYMYLPSLPEGVTTLASVEEETVLQEVAATVEVEEKLPPNEQGALGFFSGKTVLITDDDQRNIFALKTALQNEGMQVITAANGHECLTLLEETENLDLILMDIMMPVMDGYETIQAIRAQEAYQDIPIIALTAKAMKNDREKCLEVGASDYVSKPLKIEQLFSVMRVWISNQ
ncbi:sensor histidine kinase [Fictibacillus macauensis ZFHKF-1]|uniref:Circadian input-output histidine kinase CikA n=1 Tax=Fictibacillus macauensis ZFHKF-1 TaxID=1196324 RepID=I8AKM1_9BACL|nr:ATP-binding protein [Fictibacillus macauensis]EIT86392.1 sensor histidine kinase [Fictibacillus macauensis ZFHKF-1]